MNALATNIEERIYHKDDSGKKFYQKAIIGSVVLHLIMFLMKLPNMEHAIPKPKVEPIKMNFIASSITHELLKRKEEFDAIKNRPEPKLPSGVAKVTTTQEGKTGNPNGKDLTDHKSKKGSEKKGPLSDPGIASGGVGDSVTKGYEFKGHGLKALMGNSQTMTVAAGSGNEGSLGVTGGGSGKANKGSNLSGEYRSPAGTGDGSGHLLGTDAVGNYDRSTSTKGLANKKGFDTAFVEADTVVLGSIDPEVLRRILQEYLPQFKFCYQQELQENSEKIKGIVDLNFRIEGDGKVSVIKIKSAQTKFSEKGIGCMGNILHMINFPKPKGGGLVDVRQPLNFSSESTKM